MNEEVLIRRIRILQVGCLFTGFTIILRLLIIVLNYTYSLKGSWSVLIAFSILFFSGNFVFLVYHYIKKLGPSTVITFQSIVTEWKTLTPLNKLLAMSGLLSLPLTLISIGQWVTSVVSSYFER